MIDVEDITTLVGKRVVDQYGEFGTIDAITKHSIYPISVIFDGSLGREFYMGNGLYSRNHIDRHITIVEYTPFASVENDISETMSKHNLTPEELISIILERYC